MNVKGRCVFVNVDNTDRCLLIDIINDLYDEALKSKVPLPKHPTLSYTFEMKSIELLDDKGLLEMFTRFERKNVIDVWIGCGSTPSTVLQMARQVRGSEVVADEEVDELVADDLCRRQKLAVRRKSGPVLGSQSSIISENVNHKPTPNQDTSPLSTLRRSPRFI
ncbi:hypothetical protein RND81_10G056700 [Saponaria officinalis]|uniref:Uncharacterized protein n=1 Tax=Saponaria officinalis TaxID=3572 RepID=A0AAW1HY47_SAPOF